MQVREGRWGISELQDKSACWTELNEEDLPGEGLPDAQRPGPGNSNLVAEGDRQ